MPALKPGRSKPSVHAPSPRLPPCPVLLCAAQPVGAGNQFHHRGCRVLYPSQLHQAEEFQWAGAEPGGTQIAGHCGWCLLNTEAAAAATVPAPRQELLRSSGGGEGQRSTCASKLPAWTLGWALRRARPWPHCPGCCCWSQTMCVGRQGGSQQPTYASRQRRGGCSQRAVLGFAQIQGVRSFAAACAGEREPVWTDCLDSCLQNHIVLRHPGDAWPFKDHKWLAT